VDIVGYSKRMKTLTVGILGSRCQREGALWNEGSYVPGLAVSV
jgi:hypothetical protein